MDQGPLVIQEMNAGAELAREFDKYQPVKVAFWLKASDDAYRHLYIASEQINDANIDLAYGEVVRLASKIESPFFDVFQVKLISAEKPLAKAAYELRERFPSRMGNRLRGTLFGGRMIDDVYIYPSPLPAAVR